MIRIRGLVPVVSALAFAAPASATVYPMNAATWDVQGNGGFEVRDGRQALRLGAFEGKPIGGGQASLKGVKFESGVIQFDLLITAQYDFVGPVFRQVEDGFGEVIYLRPHMIGKPELDPVHADRQRQSRLADFHRARVRGASDLPDRQMDPRPHRRLSKLGDRLDRRREGAPHSLFEGSDGIGRCRPAGAGGRRLYRQFQPRSRLPIIAIRSPRRRSIRCRRIR